jgi:hypothetical protein
MCDMIVEHVVQLAYDLLATSEHTHGDVSVKHASCVRQASGTLP